MFEAICVVSLVVNMFLKLCLMIQKWHAAAHMPEGQSGTTVHCGLGRSAGDLNGCVHGLDNRITTAD